MEVAPLSDIPARGLAAFREAAASTNVPAELAAVIHAAASAGEATIGAWQVLDQQAIERQAALLMARPGWRDLPLAGVAVGVKDIFDTTDFITACGSRIYAKRRPGADAAAVAILREAGAILPGKTVTTEFAYWQQGKTRNPHDLARSPGGSSSGSAAAVAAGMVPLAIGSQTAASTIRPAAYCGIVGFKPGLHRISLAGVKGLAGSMDTAGCFANSVADVAFLAGVLARRPDWAEARWPDQALPSLHCAEAPELEQVAPWMRDAIFAVAERLAGAGAALTCGPVPSTFVPLVQVQARLMAAEAARDLAAEAVAYPDDLSAPLLTLIAEGQALSPRQQEADWAARHAAAGEIEALFAGADLLLAPSALDEAPLFEAGTGSPDLSRAWTLLGLPSLSLPAGRGPSACPLGCSLRPGRAARARSLRPPAGSRLCFRRGGAGRARAWRPIFLSSARFWGNCPRAIQLALSF